MIKCLVTGASGTVGRAVINRLSALPTIRVLAAARHSPSSWPDDVPLDLTGRLESPVSWQAALRGMDCVIHTAARVHVMRESAPHPLELYRAVNVRGTLGLAEQAAAMGVRRFVFVSSIKVNGERTLPGRPFGAMDAPLPNDPYAHSKAEAEDALRTLAARTGLEVAIVRPPLVYGPGVQANFGSLVRAIARGRPLPLGAIENRRSLVGATNLADVLAACATSPAAVGHTFLVCDDEDLSTPELARRIGDAVGRRARLINVPERLLRKFASLTGLSPQVGRLCDWLQVDDQLTRQQLTWRPPATVNDELERMAAAFKAPTRSGA